MGRERVVWKVRQCEGEFRSCEKWVKKVESSGIRPRSIRDQAPVGPEWEMAWLM